MVTVLDSSLVFPDPRGAVPRGEAAGLVAIGGDLSVERLLLAYRTGIFPWTESPLTWWSPDPRGVLEFSRFHVPRSLRAFLRRHPYRITRDRAFGEVIRACSQGRREGTWISEGFISGYEALHRAGHAHSVECWSPTGVLVGGVYGVHVGGLFAGESMFHRADHASKVALVHLVELLQERGFGLFDIQMVTPVTALLGAREWSRDRYLRRLAEVQAWECVFPPATD